MAQRHVLLRTTMLAGIAWSTPTTSFTKQLSVMAGTVHKRSVRDTNCGRRGSIAGASSTNGGMKTAVAGTPTATGMIMTTTVAGIATTITNRQELGG